MRKLHAIFWALLAGVILPGCSQKNIKEAFVLNPSFDTLYKRGKQTLARKSYRRAFEFFSEAERQHSLDARAPQAMILGAYAAYKDEAYEESAMLLDRFIALYPAHASMAYARYLQAMCYYKAVMRPFVDDSTTYLALQAMRDVRRLFPQTPYARDAAVKEKILYEQLATRKINIGRLHQDYQSHVGALRVFQALITENKDSELIPEAMYRLIETHLSLGIRLEAERIAGVMNRKWPDNLWTKRAVTLVAQHGLSPAVSPQKPVAAAVA